MDVPKVSTKTGLADKLGTIMARLTINRANYKVQPGLYAIGTPSTNSNVFVSANYKLSFDSLRKELSGMDAWILVLDTKGINVWCAAGEGTFGTQELIERISITKLNEVVNQKKLIVPQLGAVGIAAHIIKEETGFNVIYGPVRAKDIPEFLKAGFKATPEMRRVNFSFVDRSKLVAAEFALGFKYLFIASVILIAFSQYNLCANILLAYFGGTILGPLLLPWLPGRAFFMKGVFAGLIVFIIAYIFGFTGKSVLSIAGSLFLMTTLASFMLMNFTGASTYTSFSGVKKEMKFAVPLQAGVLVVAVII
ncbi:MAG: acetyl-CoA synthase subunit gamma, partial [Elusimicrobia bacterium]|nr:acetyl-CoA synthase subunit gamma [Elusimicrobiota bacterium]